MGSDCVDIDQIGGGCAFCGYLVGYQFIITHNTPVLKRQYRFPAFKMQYNTLVYKYLRTFCVSLVVIFTTKVFQMSVFHLRTKQCSKSPILHCTSLTFFCFCGVLFNHKLTPKILLFSKFIVSLLCRNTCAAAHVWQR